MSEEIGKHKGAVETLLHEKKELSRLLQIVNSQLERHLSALEEAGIDTDKFIQDIQEGQKQQKESRQQSQNNQQGKQRSQKDRTDKQKRNQRQRSRSSEQKGSSSDDRDFSPL